MEKRVGYVCASCGSSAVMMDAWAVWDTEKQDWELGDTCTQSFCRECDGDASLIEVELAAVT
jgi:hypothetical protein